MNRMVRTAAVSLLVLASMAPSQSAKSATFIDVDVGDTIRADFDLTGVQLPLVTDLNVNVQTGLPNFSYEFHSGGLSPVTGTVTSIGFQPGTVTASAFTTYALLSGFTSNLTSLVFSLHYPDRCIGVTGACTPLIQGELTKVNTSPVPVPAALPLLATGLGALGVIGWRRKRKLAQAHA